MTKNAVSDWDTVATNNTDVGGIDLGEGTMLMSRVNDALRTIMAQIKAAGFASISLGTGVATFLATPTSANLRAAMTDESGAGALLFAGGALGTPASGVGTNLTGIPVAALTGTLPVASGGSGATTLTGLLKGNGTSAFTAATKGTDYYAPSSTDVAVVDGGTGASDAATARTNLGLVIGTNVQAFNASYATLNDAAQVVTGGARVTSDSLGTVSSGTLTLDPGNRPLQHYTNGGAHTLAPGANGGSILLDILNSASAGAITLTGWTKVVGAFDTTSGHKFRCSATIGNGGSLLTIQALQ